MREKLIEQAVDILEKWEFFYGQRAGRELWADKPKDVQDEDIESFNRDISVVRSAIANGVTVQEWISVNDERKPKYGEDVLVVVFDGYDTYTDTDCLMRDGKWCYETENHKVTHWQPMPQPPKGE